MKAEAILENHRLETEVKVLPWDTSLQYEGRIDFAKEEGPVWVYPATFVKLRFTGKSLRAVVTNVHSCWENSLGFLVDGVEHKSVLQENGITQLVLAEGLAPGEHEICLFKRQDSCHQIIFHGFLGDESLRLLPPKPFSDKRIEVYGDSVSAGEVSEAVDYCGLPDPVHNGEYSNSYYSYAWLTARKLNARIHDIAQGGIALLDGTGWFYEGNYIGLERTYDKITYHPDLLPIKDWDFSQYVPQVVIVAIGQNDANPVNYMAEDYEGSKSVLWRERYGAFLKKLRSIYPKAYIICTTTILGHDANWDKAIDQVCSTLGDDRVYHFLYENNGCGTQGHIRIPEAEKMAEELSSFITSLGEQIWEE